MVNNRRSVFNIAQMRNDFETLNMTGVTQVEFDELAEFAKLYQVYEAAQNEVATKLENLDAEFELRYQHNPIHHIDGRMKEPRSLVGKVEKKHLPRTISSVRDNVFDIAGLRVITNYIDDIYTIEKFLTQQDDVKVLKRKDYVANPKESGYRSLHLVVTVPVFLSTGPEITPVEIQIRTIGMDMWASLEHKLRYKTRSEEADNFSQMLGAHANQLFAIEQSMQEIHHQL